MCVKHTRSRTRATTRAPGRSRARVHVRTHALPVDDTKIPPFFVQRYNAQGVNSKHEKLTPDFPDDAALDFHMRVVLDDVRYARPVRHHGDSRRFSIEGTIGLSRGDFLHHQWRLRRTTGAEEIILVTPTASSRV